MPTRRDILRISGALAVLWLAGPLPPAQAQGRGRIRCEITENGEAASGTLTVEAGGREVASGDCASPVAVPAGQYAVTVQLDGALDRPEQRRQVTIQAGATETVRADFATAVLEVNITAGGRRAAAMATLFKNGARVGTLGSGVAAHVSAGTYDVVVRYRGVERRFAGVTLARGQRRTLSADF